MENVIAAMDLYVRTRNYDPDVDDRDVEAAVSRLTEEQKVVYDFGVHCYRVGEGDAHKKITGTP